MLKPGTRKAKDAELAARFAEWYCAAHHGAARRSVLESDGGRAGIYRKRKPVLCDECAEYVRYAELRTEKCPKDPMPFCSRCDIKCYSPEMAQYSRAVMRYSAPRSIFSRYCLRAIRYMAGQILFRHRP